MAVDEAKNRVVIGVAGRNDRARTVNGFVLQSVVRTKCLNALPSYSRLAHRPRFLDDNSVSSRRIEEQIRKNCSRLSRIFRKTSSRASIQQRRTRAHAQSYRRDSENRVGRFRDVRTGRIQ